MGPALIAVPPLYLGALASLLSALEDAPLIVVLLFIVVWCLSFVAWIFLANGDPGFLAQDTADREASRNMCSVCRCVKLPRSHHCSVCGRCVALMDHHCHVSNSCVGAQNLRIFILWLAYTLAAASIGAGLKWHQRHTDLGVAVLSMFLAIAISCSAFFGRQLYLLWAGRTLIEEYFGGGGQPRGWSNVRKVMSGGLLPVPRELEIQCATTL